MKDETERVVADIKLIKLMPKTLTCVGQSYVIQTKKKVYQVVIEKVIIKMATSMPILLDKDRSYPEVFVRQTKISMNEQIKVKEKLIIAISFLGQTLMGKQANTVATKDASPKTSPFMKILS